MTKAKTTSNCTNNCKHLDCGWCYAPSDSQYQDNSGPSGECQGYYACENYARQLGTRTTIAEEDDDYVQIVYVH